jgi:hypothetical protein
MSTPVQAASDIRQVATDPAIPAPVEVKDVEETFMSYVFPVCYQFSQPSGVAAIQMRTCNVSNLNMECAVVC